MLEQFGTPTKKKDATTIFVYGTFNIRRKQFHKLFSVFVKSVNLYVLVVFNLFPNKTTENYNILVFVENTREWSLNDPYRSVGMKSSGTVQIRC